MDLKKALRSSVFVILLLSTAYAQGITEYKRYDKVTVAWNPVSSSINRYDVGYKRDGESTIIATPVSASTTSYTLIKPRSGKFTIYVRACNSNECSRWADSTSSIDTNSKPFKVFFPPKGPTDVRMGRE